ncbi:hypothetical protein FO519_005045 [Halicephalobus sp. NKZ332]|nr:hypothetical protein FO519_005045 [Halicephalobus sp. NKZ332]
MMGLGVIVVEHHQSMDQGINVILVMILTFLDEKATPHHTRWCNGCRSDKYPGMRYACKICSDFDLCERCYAEYRFDPSTNYTTTHKSSHEMIKYKPSTSDHHSNDIWTAMSIKMQNYFGSQLGTRDWDKLDTDIKEEWTNLAKKIGYAIYGPPTIVPDESNNSYYGYDDEKEKHIMSLRQRVLELNRKAWNDEKLPIIRVFRAKPNYSYFVEPNGRTYDSWADFLDKNKLPECEICYPIGGWYQADEKGYCDLWFRNSAECDTSRQLVKGTDALATVAGIGGTVLGVIGLFTPLAPLAAGALATTAVTTGGYGVARGTYKLVDRATHGESINPFDNRESFFCWFSIVGSVFAMGSMAGVSYASRAAMTGSHVGQSMRIVINTAIFGNLGINAVGIVANVVNVVERFESGDVPVLELFQLSASILFFTNSVVNIQYASSIIKDVQKARLSEIRNQLSDDTQRLNFDRQILHDRYDNLPKGKTGEMHGAEVTIGRLDRLMQNSNWQEAFGGNNISGSVSAQRHALQPTHFANGVDIVIEEAAIARAQQAHNTRFGGTRVNEPSTNTVIAIPPHELDSMAVRGLRDGNQVMLPGTYYGYNIELGPGGVHLSSQPIEIINPVFTVRGSEAVHFNARNTTMNNINQLPPHVPITVNLSGDTIRNFQFTQFIRTTNRPHNRNSNDYNFERFN